MSESIIALDEGPLGSTSACRLCLEKDPNVQDIFNIERMSEKMHTFLHFEVTVDDQWPLVICPGCIARINEWEAYYELVQKTKMQNLSNQEEDTVAGVLYEINEISVKGDHEGDPPILEKYELVCISKPDNLQDLANEDEDDDNMIDLANDDTDGFAVEQEYMDDAEGVDEEEGEEEQAEEEELTELYREVRLEKTPKRNKRGRPRKNVTEELSPRQQDDVLIQETVSLDCENCFEPCCTFEDLLAHYKSVHGNPNGYVKCCQKTFKRRYVLVEHVRLHKNPDQYSCPNCHKRFTTKRHLTDHMLLHIPEEDREFQCPKCLKRYPSHQRLLLHLKTHNEELSFKCPYCEKAFRQEVVLKSHIKSVHEKINEHICEICARVFKTKEGFLIHQVEHLDTPPERLKCEICGGRYKNRDSLKYHMLRHKRAHERYYCDVCNKEFNCKKRMRSHRKYVHATENELFQCTMCDKAFKRPIVLKEHMAAHTGQLLYTCAYCPKQFNSNANKYSHQKAQHPVEWSLARQQKLTAA